MKRTKANSDRILPWWLSEDSDACIACSHPYAYRTEVFCFDCDGPVCPICIERTTTLEMICPGCLESRTLEEVM